jgi:Protein of unknown function (DUF3558)
MRLVRIVAASGLCFAIAVGAACKEAPQGEEKAASAAPAEPGVEPAAAETAPASPPAKPAAEGVDPCALLTEAEIEEVLGQKLPVVSTAAESPDKNSPGCMWQNESISLVVMAATEAQIKAGFNSTAEARYELDKSVRPPGDEISDVSGLGDAAFWSQKVGLTILRRGKALVTIAVSSKDMTEKLERARALGAKIMSRL